MEHYLDNAATTKPCAEAAAAVMSCISAHYGNPSSLHRKGLEAQHEVEYARNQIAGALGCKAQEIVFTSGATESSNLAIRGAVAAYGRKRKKIVASAVEHASVKATLSYLETLGFTVVTVPPAADGEYHTEDFLREIDSSVCLVSMMLVNNENGCRLPVENVFRMVKRNDPEIITHCDAVQGFLKIPFKPRTLCADLVSVSGHKVHALKGVGALYIRHGVRVKPILCGSEQERGLRPGTESVPLIASFGAATEKAVPEHRRTSGTGFSASQQFDRTAAGNGRRDHSGHRGSISLCAEHFPAGLSLGDRAALSGTAGSLCFQRLGMFQGSQQRRTGIIRSKARRGGQCPANQLLCREHRGGYCGTGTGTAGRTERTDALIQQKC